MTITSDDLSLVQLHYKKPQMHLTICLSVLSFYIFLDKEALRLLLKNNYHQELQPAKTIEVSVYIFGQ